MLIFISRNSNTKPPTQVANHATSSKRAQFLQLLLTTSQIPRKSSQLLSQSKIKHEITFHRLGHFFVPSCKTLDSTGTTLQRSFLLFLDQRAPLLPFETLLARLTLRDGYDDNGFTFIISLGCGCRSLPHLPQEALVNFILSLFQLLGRLRGVVLGVVQPYHDGPEYHISPFYATAPP